MPRLYEQQRVFCQGVGSTVSYGFGWLSLSGLVAIVLGDFGLFCLEGQTFGEKFRF